MYLLDTNICIDFLRGELADGYRLMRQMPRESFKLPSVVVAELLLGVEKAPARWRALEQRMVGVFLDEFDVVGFDENCSRTYARIRAELERRGQIIGPMDLLIASIAVANNAVLVTNNIREFSRVPGISLEGWYEVKLADE